MNGASVTIENLRAVPTVLNLDYRDAKETSLAVRQKRAKLHKAPDGWRALKVEHARLSASVSLRPRGKEGCAATGLPPSVVSCQDVVSKKALGWIKVIHLTAAETEAQSAKLHEARERKAQGQKRLVARLAERRKGAPPAPPAAATPKKRRRAAAGAES